MGAVWQLPRLNTEAIRAVDALHGKRGVTGVFSRLEQLTIDEHAHTTNSHAVARTSGKRLIAAPPTTRDKWAAQSLNARCSFIGDNDGDIPKPHRAVERVTSAA